MQLSENKNWFVIQTKPRTEKKVEKQLIDKGVEVLLPLITSLRYCADRKKNIKAP